MDLKAPRKESPRKESMTTEKHTSKLKKWIIQNFIECGVRPQDSFQVSRAIRISNVINLTAIFNTFFLVAVFFAVGEIKLANTTSLVGLVYMGCFSLNYVGLSKLGRQLIMITGSFFVFYYGCIFRGESHIQLILYSLSILPFMYFAWEERKNFILCSIPISLVIIGELYHWNFFEQVQGNYNMQMIRIFFTPAPIFQILAGFYHFMKLAVKFEKQSNENFRLLEIEHKKQLQVQKMSSLGEMAAGVSHEINNPLTVIMGKAFAIKRDLQTKLPDDSTIAANVNKIEEMVVRISRIIKALRNFSRNSENDETQIVPLHEVLDSTLDLCRERFASNGIKLNVNIDRNIMVKCRATEISQVILNLLNNSFDAVHDKADACIDIEAHKYNANMAEVVVADNGIGITPEVAHKIMQPFFTTKAVGKGTGLGLSISKGLVESNKGELNFLAEKSKTTFQVLLPLEK